MKKRYLNDLVKKCIITRIVHLDSTYLKFPQLRKFFLEKKGVHKSWYNFFDFQYKNQGFLYISPHWQIHKVLNKNILSLPRVFLMINDFSSEEWEYLINKYEKKIFK